MVQQNLLQKKNTNEDIVNAEKDAENNKRGLWSDDNTKKKNIKNIHWSDSNVQEVFNKNKGTLTSIVEHVVSGSTIKVLIGNVVVAMHMTGVQSPTGKVEKTKNDKGEDVHKKKNQIQQNKQNILQNNNYFIETFH